jgi:hypothetical protein
VTHSRLIGLSTPQKFCTGGARDELSRRSSSWLSASGLKTSTVTHDRAGVGPCGRRHLGPSRSVTRLGAAKLSAFRSAPSHVADPL